MILQVTLNIQTYKGPHLSVAEMGKFYDSCFSPENLAIYFDKTEETDGYRVYDDDMTQCYYESKLDKYIERDFLQIN